MIVRCFFRSRPQVFFSYLVGLAMVIAPKSGFAQEQSPVPSKDTQKAIEKVLTETYNLGATEGTTKKQEAMKKLLAVSRDPNLTADERYVVLTTVIPLARDAGDFVSWSEAVDALVNEFDIEGKQEKIRLLTEFLGTCKSAAVLKPAVEECIAIARKATEENRYADATVILTAAETTIRRVTGAKSLQKTVTEAREAAASREKLWKEFQTAAKTLELVDDDPVANLTVGRWHVLQDDWDAALPFLAKASDVKWKAAADLEQKTQADAVAQVAVGDAWWDIAEKEASTAKTVLFAHAGDCYTRALPNLNAGLTKSLVATRLDKIAALKTAAQATVPNQPLPKKIVTKAQQDNELAVGEWIDLLAMVKLPDNALHGKWQRRDGALVCEASGNARFMVPVAIRGSYELTCEFTRRTNNEAIGVVLPVGSTACAIEISAGGGAMSGLQMVDGRDITKIDQATGVRPGKINNGQLYRLHIKVAQESARATVEAKLDDKRFVAWTGNVAQLSVSPAHVLPCLRVVSLMAHDSVADFHKLQLRVKHGAKAYRLGDDWGDPLSLVADTAPKDIASKCLTWNGRRYFVSDKPMDFPTAQRLAEQLNGRLLTISSVEEEAFLLEQGRGLSLWLSGWRRANSSDWRDERNRRLQFIGSWGPGQPQLISKEMNLAICTTAEGVRGIHDDVPWNTHHACIEWGEEYPEKK